MQNTIKDLSLYDLKKIASIQPPDVESVELRTTFLRLDYLVKNHSKDAEYIVNKPKYQRVSLVVDSVKFILIANK